MTIIDVSYRVKASERRGRRLMLDDEMGRVYYLGTDHPVDEEPVRKVDPSLASSRKRKPRNVT